MASHKDYTRMVSKADALIAKFGQPTPAQLRRDGDDRPCTAVIIDYRWQEKSQRMEGAVRFLISVLDPTTGQPLLMPPDYEQDLLVFAQNVYRLPTPDEGLRPGGTIIYHDFQAVYDGVDDQTS